MSETNIFAEKAGFSVHFKLAAADLPHTEGQSDLAALMAGTNTMLAWMKAHEYKHDTSRDRGGFGGGGGRRPNVPATLPTGEEAKCPTCTGPMYDNITDNNKRAAAGEKLRPDFKCKTKDCDGAIWRPKDGWAKPPALGAQIPQEHAQPVKAPAPAQRAAALQNGNAASAQRGDPTKLWTRARELGLGRDEVFAQAGLDDFGAFTQQEYDELTASLRSKAVRA